MVELGGPKASENARIHLPRALVHVDYAERILGESLDTTGSKNALPQFPPSLEILVFVMQKILYPDFLYTKIADFLRLLSMVEFWRLRALSVISNALVYQEYYKETKDQDYILLPQFVEDLFIVHKDDDIQWRNVFAKILSTCIEVHLQRLWITDCNTEFWIQWNEYYSALEKIYCDEPSTVSTAFCHRLSIEDKGQLLRSMENCKDFINGTLQGQGNTPPTMGDILLDMIHSYLNYVHDFVAEVHEVFPTEFPLPTM